MSSTIPESGAPQSSSAPSSASDDRLAIYRAIVSYNWDTDQEFQAGLRTILSNAPAEKTSELTLRAKCFFWKRKNGTIVDFNDFKSWVASFNTLTNSTGLSDQAPASTLSPLASPTSLSPDARPSSPLSPPPPPPPTRTATDATGTISSLPSFLPADHKPGEVISTVAPGDDAPYPKSFQEIVDLITSGKPIPGIKEIPDIVKEGEGSESARPERRKPWEIAAEKKQEGGSGDGLGARQEAMETKKGGVEA